MANIKRNTNQFSITMSPAVFQKMEQEAEKLGMNRSAFISMCVSQYFNMSEAQYMLSQMNDLLARAQAMKDEAQFNLFREEDSRT